MKIRLRRNDIIQFIKFFLGGSVWFWSGYLIFVLCYGLLHWQWWQAKVLADIIGWSLNYLLQRYWAFSNPLLARHGRQVKGRYLAISVLNVGLDYVIVGALKWLGLTPFIGLFVAAGFFTVWNYVWYRWWVFPHKFKK